MASPAIDPTRAATARVSANRENAQHSTGPRTSDGKERVRLNALKHGLFSTTVVLPYEDASVFEALRDKITNLYIPASDEQLELLNAFIETQWRLNRVLSIEGNLYAVGIREELEPATNFFKDYDRDAHIAIARARAYREQARTFDQLHRQEMRLRRLLERQMNAYLELMFQTEEEDIDIVADPAPESLGPPLPEPLTAAAAASGGFVSHNSPHDTQAHTSEPATMPHFTGSLAEFKRKQWQKQHGK